MDAPLFTHASLADYKACATWRSLGWDDLSRGAFVVDAAMFATNKAVTGTVNGASVADTTI